MAAYYNGFSGMRPRPSVHVVYCVHVLLRRAVALQDCIDALMPRGISYVFQTGSGFQQLFGNLFMIASRLMDGRPDRCPERCPIVHTSRFEWSARANEQSHRFQLSAVGGPMKRVQAGARSSRRTDSLLQQVVRDARTAEKACTGQRFR